MEQVGKRIGQGYTAEVYEYGADKILKLYRQGMPDAACQREFEATKNIGRSFAASPKAFEMLRIDGRMGAVYEKIAGATMLNVMLRRILRLRAYSRELAQIHFSIQIVDLLAQAGFQPGVICLSA